MAVLSDVRMVALMAGWTADSMAGWTVASTALWSADYWGHQSVVYSAAHWVDSLADKKVV